MSKFTEADAYELARLGGYYQPEAAALLMTAACVAPTEEEQVRAKLASMILDPAVPLTALAELMPGSAAFKSLWAAIYGIHRDKRKRAAAQLAAELGRAA